MKELLAAYAHNQWSGWMKYLFSKGKTNIDGTWTMPKWAVQRWQKQMNTQYKDLSVQEKESDIEEANGMLKIFSNGIDK